jgi:hypothetical protein
VDVRDTRVQCTPLLHERPFSTRCTRYSASAPARCAGSGPGHGPGARGRRVNRLAPRAGSRACGDSQRDRRSPRCARLWRARAKEFEARGPPQCRRFVLTADRHRRALAENKGFEGSAKTAAGGDPVADREGSGGGSWSATAASRRARAGGCAGMRARREIRFVGRFVLGSRDARLARGLRSCLVNPPDAFEAELAGDARGG